MGDPWSPLQVPYNFVKRRNAIMEENGTYRWTPPNAPKAPNIPKDIKIP